MNAKQKGKLPRLQREFYRGCAVVFWTLTLEHRVQGWLNVCFHARFRALMLHAAVRSHLLCPAYSQLLRTTEYSDDSLRAWKNPIEFGSPRPNEGEDEGLREAFMG